MNKRDSVQKRLVTSAPLIPPIASLMIFVAILSPLTWYVEYFIYIVLLAAIAISVVSAYCIAAFIENLKKP